MVPVAATKAVPKVGSVCWEHTDPDVPDIVNPVQVTFDAHFVAHSILGFGVVGVYGAILDDKACPWLFATRNPLGAFPSTIYTLDDSVPYGYTDEIIENVLHVFDVELYTKPIQSVVWLQLDIQSFTETLATIYNTSVPVTILL